MTVTTNKVPIGIPGVMKAVDINSMSRGLTAVLYGHPGTGKTKTAAGLRAISREGDVLFIDCEGGSLTLGGLEGVQVVRVTSWLEFDKLLTYIERNQSELGIHTVVVDTLSALQELGMNDVLNSASGASKSIVPGIADWGKNAAQLVRAVRRLCDMSENKRKVDGTVGLGWNVVFICHLTDDKDGVTGAISHRPALQPKSAEAISGIVDVVGLVTADRKLGRMLKMENSAAGNAKIRQPASRPSMPTQLVIQNTVRSDGTEDTSVVPVLALVYSHLAGAINLNDAKYNPITNTKKEV